MPRKLKSNAQKQFEEKLEALIDTAEQLGVENLGNDRIAAAARWEKLKRQKQEIVKMYEMVGK